MISESLTHTVNFGIGSAFSKSPGPDPFYKVCRSEAAVRRCFTKWLFLKILQNSQGNMYVGVTF